MLLLPALTFGPMVCALICYIAGRHSDRLRNVLTAVTGALAFAGCLLLWRGEVTFTLDGFCGLGLHLRADGFRSLYATVAAFMWMLTGTFAPEYFAHYRNKNRYTFFNLMTLGATLGVFLSDDLYSTFIFFEIMSLTSYTWVAHDENPAAMKAAGTYLAVAVTGGLVTLMGLFMLWHDLGTLSFTALREAMEAFEPWCMENGLEAAAIMPRVKVASWLVLFGFAAKAGLFPLHIWLPKAHPVAPAPASALLSGILTKSGVFGLIVICADLRMGSHAFGNALLIAACITMFLGALLALLSVDLKRTLACSSMSQIGFITVGLSCMVLMGEEGGMAAGGALLHMVNHSLIKLCLFMCAGVVYMNLHKLNLNDIRGFGRKKPVLHICFLLGALAIGCVPPLGSGYASKSLIHEGLLEYIHILQEEGGNWVPVKAAEILFLISGGLTIAYMTKLYICIFWQKNADPAVQEKHDAKKRSMSPLSGAVLLLSAVILPVLGLMPDRFMLPLAERSMAFFGQVLPHHIEFFSAENLIGAAKSAVIGAAVYLLIVRPLLMPKRDGVRVYVDRWPKKLDLEELIYRPLMLKILPGVTGFFTGILAALPEKLAAVWRVVSVFFVRLIGDSPEWIVVAARRSVFRRNRKREPVLAGNRITWSIGRMMNRFAALINRTTGRAEPLRTDHEMTLGARWDRGRERVEGITGSMSWGLLLMAVGLLITCLYLLLHG